MEHIYCYCHNKFFIFWKWKLRNKNWQIKIRKIEKIFFFDKWLKSVCNNFGWDIDLFHRPLLDVKSNLKVRLLCDRRLGREKQNEIVSRGKWGEVEIRLAHCRYIQRYVLSCCIWLVFNFLNLLLQLYIFQTFHLMFYLFFKIKNLIH